MSWYGNLKFKEFTKFLENGGEPLIGGAMIIGAGLASQAIANSGSSVNGGAGTTETYYRTMSQADYQTFIKTGKVPATGETFISPSQAYSAGYDGVLVEFKVNAGTTSTLQSIGVRDASGLTGNMYGNMPNVSSGWTNSNAFFKAEGSVVNIGLGQGKALDIFNNNIVSSSVVGGN